MLAISELLGSETRVQDVPESSLNITPCPVPATKRECWLGAYASARTPNVEISLTRDHVLPQSRLSNRPPPSAAITPTRKWLVSSGSMRMDVNSLRWRLGNERRSQLAPASELLNKR